MIGSLLNLVSYSRNSEDRMYSSGTSSSAVTLGAKTIGGMRGNNYSKGGTFDYLSTAENTIECYYQKLDDLRYYESHALTEKVVGLFRDYISQLWKEGAEIVDIPGESRELVDELNKELESLDILETLMKDLNLVIFYGSVSYEISGVDAKDTTKDPASSSTDDVDKDNRNLYKSKESIDKLKDRRYSDLGGVLNSSTMNKVGFYEEIGVPKEVLDRERLEYEDREYALSQSKANKILIESTSPEVSKFVDETSPKVLRGVREATELQSLDTKRLNPIRGKESTPYDDQKVSDIRRNTTYVGKLRLNKLKYPHHTVVEYHRKEGRRYLVKADEKWHLPVNKHDIFYYGNDSMRISEASEGRHKKSMNSSYLNHLVGASDSKEKDRMKKLGVDPKDPKKKPTRYELLEKELSAGSPLFYHHLPKVRELYLKDLVVSILGIKDVIQPDILAMNFEGGMDVDQAQDMCNDLEDLLNKNSDYSIFNSAALDYNDLTKLLVDTVRVLPDIEGKLQSLNPIRTTTLQDKIQQIRMEAKELQSDILASLGVPMDLFEGQSSKWEVIKRSERLQSRVNYYINTLKGSLRRISQSVFYHLNNRELRPSDFKITVFNESELELASKTNKLQSLTELTQTLVNIVVSSERDLSESQLINKTAYFHLLKSSLKEIYPEIDDLLVIPEEDSQEGQSQDGDQGDQDGEQDSQMEQ